MAPVDFDDCAPEKHWGEVSHLYIGSLDVPDFLDVSSIIEWNSILSDTEDDHIRTMTVIGDLPETEVTEIQMSGDRIAIGYKTFTLNFEVDETNDINYQWHQLLECGGKFKIWFETSDGILYGGNTGIEASVRMNLIIPRERTALVKFMGKASWKSLQSPPRCLSPLY